MTSLGSTILRKHLDDVPLWRGDHVAVKQLVEDFGRYLYLPRLKEPAVLLDAIRDGLGLLTWAQDSFAYAESFDETAGRYRGLRCGQQVPVSESDLGLLVRPEVAREQQEAERPTATGVATGAEGAAGDPGTTGSGATTGTGTTEAPRAAAAPKRYHGSVTLDTTRVGRDASRVADEVISHLAGLVGSEVTVTLEIEAKIPSGAPDNVVRTVTENSRTLKFAIHGFEKE